MLHQLWPRCESGIRVGPSAKSGSDPDIILKLRQFGWRRGSCTSACAARMRIVTSQSAGRVSQAPGCTLPSVSILVQSRSRPFPGDRVLVLREAGCVCRRRLRRRRRRVSGGVSVAPSQICLHHPQSQQERCSALPVMTVTVLASSLVLALVVTARPILPNANDAPQPYGSVI